MGTGIEEQYGDKFFAGQSALVGFRLSRLDGFSSLIPAIEAGTGVAIVTDTFAHSAGKRVKLLRLIPEPEKFLIGLAAPQGPLHPTVEIFWECAIAATQTVAGDDPGRQSVAA